MTVRVRSSSAWIITAGVILAAPFVFVGSYPRFLIAASLLFALLAVSWNLTLGVAGIFNFGHLAFFAIGTYTTGILTVDYSWSVWPALLAGTCAGGVAGAVAFLPVFRLRGIYVALVTFVFAQICSFVVINSNSLTGGMGGLVGLPFVQIGSFDLTANGGLGFCLLIGAVLLIVVLLLDRLSRSPYGHSLVALRENEQYALSRGLPAFRIQLKAFVISGAIAGATGGLFGLYYGVVSTELFGFGYLTLVLSMIFLGGSGSVYGPILGAVVIEVLSDRLKSHGPWSNIVVAALIVVVLRFLPGGLVSLPRLIRRYLLRARNSAHRTAPDADRDPAHL